MAWRRGARTSPRLVVVAAALAALAARTTASEPQRPQLRMRILLPGDAAVLVARAVDGAARRLRRVECAAVFEEWVDPSGSSLGSKARALAPSASDYLRLLVFVDGREARACGASRNQALTRPGHRVVRVCPAFLWTQRRDPALAEVLIIHEALHSLGLGENPPSSLEITARVVQRCGRSPAQSRGPDAQEARR